MVFLYYFYKNVLINYIFSRSCETGVPRLHHSSTRHGVHESLTLTKDKSYPTITPNCPFYYLYFTLLLESNKRIYTHTRVITKPQDIPFLSSFLENLLLPRVHLPPRRYTSLSPFLFFVHRVPRPRQPSSLLLFPFSPSQERSRDGLRRSKGK